MDSKALSSTVTRSQKKKLKQTTQCPFNTVQVSPERIRVNMEERILVLSLE